MTNDIKDLVNLAEEIIHNHTLAPTLPIPMTYETIKGVFDLHPRKIPSALHWVFSTKDKKVRLARLTGTLNLHSTAYKNISTPETKSAYTANILETLQEYYD